VKWVVERVLAPRRTHKFHQDWFMCSKVDMRGLTDTQTPWISHKPVFIFLNKLKYAKQ
jgi:hypothetical protein